MPRAIWNGTVLAEADAVQRVEGEGKRDAAWYYPVTKAAAEHIAGHVAFWKGVQVEDD